MPRYAVTCTLEKYIEKDGWYGSIENIVTLALYEAKSLELAKALAVVNETENHQDFKFVKVIGLEIPEVKIDV